jgi:hypothetical protein
MKHTVKSFIESLVLASPALSYDPIYKFIERKDISKRDI